MQVHRTKFEFKNIPNITLYLDRVSFSDGFGVVEYSLLGDVSSNILENVQVAHEVQEEIKSFEHLLKPCRSKIIQVLFDNQVDVYKSTVLSRIERTSNRTEGRFS